MQSPTPPDASAHDPARGPSAEAQLSDAVTLVVAGAKRRAVRDGDPQIDTAHLLHSLLEADPEVRAAFPEGAQVARLLGYLVQRSIGYGLQWQGTVEDSGAVPLLGAAAPDWSPAVAVAMDAGIERALARGRTHARGTDILAALAADPECRAVEVLRRAGVDVPELVRRLG
ncbi:Clp protease N-terminal domain-containing protein [Streptomyces beihaiensis]|uniref:Peptidase n=1 Tax=Streptomyces beihaiensis TaxID=2984495 RepID=A0ABT3TZ13_9ACTN|nr:Clp protease N-terminal domain-containing protein [Streptomyces beihaiensis]MCX3062276.1 peptidase [Streptomyces beihaiensis]